MSTPALQRDWLNDLDRTMRREIAIQRSSIEELWALPLAERVRDGRSLGLLDLVAATDDHVRLVPRSTAAETAHCSLREGDFVRLSQDSPQSPTSHCIFLGEDHDGIHLHRWKGTSKPASGPGWTIDPDFIDLTDRYAEAINALAETVKGRDRILPLLMGEVGSQLESELFDETMESLSEPPEPDAPKWHDSQQEAIATCVAARDAFLVQGPPGTGKTRVLGEVARRLIDQGQRLLISGPTHRAIHNALAAVREALPPTVRVAKIGPAPLGDSLVECHESYTESGLLDCGEPHVIGATSHALWSKYHGLREATFDTVLIDEASQVTPLLAAMAMLRSEKWLFFGDDCQLPPVVLSDTATPPRLRSVFGVLKNRDFNCMLNETWRLNRPLAAWPSATFYGNHLVTRHDRRLALAPPSSLPDLAPEPALFLHECTTQLCTVRSDEEAQHAAALVRELVRGGIAPNHIGVITPFRAQAGRIRQLLAIHPEAPGLHRHVVTDTVERFQGQERDVIIVTFAASNSGFINFRADFLLQHERLNVAVTRARLKTILIASRILLDCVESLAESGHEGATCFSSLVHHIRNQSLT